MLREKAIIFGASTLGKIAYRLLKDEYDVCYFCDNDISKWNSDFCGINIIPPNDLINFSNYTIIIASMYSMEIAYQLYDMNLSNVKVFHCDNVESINKANSYVLNDAFPKEEFNYIDENLISIPYIKKSSVNKSQECIKNMRKNILIVSYIFPPIGGSGVQRTLKFTKYLYELGWNPIVVTTDEVILPYSKDYSLLKEIPIEVQVIRIKHDKFSPEELNRDEISEILMLQQGLLDNNLFYEYIKKIKQNVNKERKMLLNPDNSIIWANKVLREICNIVDMKNIDIIYTTSGPYSDHIIGYYLKKKFQIPWVADFRDEWTNNLELNLDKNSFVYKIQRNMEEKIVQLADKILTVTPLHTENYIKSFEIANDKVCTITNGYDEHDFINIQTENIKNDKFIIAYNGTMYSKRNPYSVILALNSLISKNLVNKEKIELHFTGYCEISVLKKIRYYDKYNICRFNEYLDHKESLYEASKSDVLLLILGKDERYKEVYTGKVFEYLRLYKPIIALSPQNSVVEKLLVETNTGVNVEDGNIKKIGTAILKCYNSWLNNEILFKYRKEKIQKYERKELTKKLENILNSLLYRK